MGKNKGSVLLTVLVAGVISLTGCGNITPTNPAETVPTQGTTPTTPVQDEPTRSGVVGSTVEMLNTLTVTPEQETGYDRDLFNHWVTSNPTGCDTRVAVLIREARNGYLNGCSVSGEWTSLYDGLVFTNPGDLDIDHMVPLKEAWGSGAYAWDANTREQYANDLDYPYSLIAVSASSNRAKSDKDPAEWMPSSMNACEYVSRWVGVKYRWNLTVDLTEKNTILDTLNTCGGDYAIGADPATITQNIVPAQPPTPDNNTTVPQSSTGADPQFSTCKEAKSAGYGPYVQGTDEEYVWYSDRDGDGVVCE